MENPPGWALVLDGDHLFSAGGLPQRLAGGASAGTNPKVFGSPWRCRSMVDPKDLMWHFCLLQEMTVLRDVWRDQAGGEFLMGVVIFGKSVLEKSDCDPSEGPVFGFPPRGALGVKNEVFWAKNVSHYQLSSGPVRQGKLPMNHPIHHPVTTLQEVTIPTRGSLVTRNRSRLAGRDP